MGIAERRSLNHYGPFPRGIATVIYMPSSEFSSRRPATAPNRPAEGVPSSRSAAALGHANYARALAKLRREGKEPTVDAIYAEVQRDNQETAELAAKQPVQAKAKLREAPVAQAEPDAPPPVRHPPSPAPAVRPEWESPAPLRGPSPEQVKLGAELQESAARIRELENSQEQLRIQAQLIPSLQGQLDAQQITVEEDARLIESLRRELRELTRQNARMADLEIRLAAQETAFDTQRERENSLHERLLAEQKHRREAEQKLREWQEESRPSADIAATQERLAALEAVRSELERENGQLREREADFASKSAQFSEKEQTLAGEVARLRQQLEESSARRDADVRRAEMRAMTLQSRLDATQQSLNDSLKWRDELNSRLLDYEKLQAEVRDLAAKNEVLSEITRKQSESQAERQHAAADIEAQRDALLMREVDLCERLRVAEESVGAAYTRREEEMRLLQQQIEEMKAELAEARKMPLNEEGVEPGHHPHVVHLLTRISEMEPELEDLRKLRPIFKEQARTVKNQEIIIQNLQRRLAAAEEAGPLPSSTPAVPAEPEHPEPAPTDWSQVAASLPSPVPKSRKYFAAAVLVIVGLALGHLLSNYRAGVSGSDTDATVAVVDPADLFYGNDPQALPTPPLNIKAGNFAGAPRLIWNNHQGDTTLPLAGLFNPNGQFDYSLLRQIWTESEQGKLAPRTADSSISELKDGYDTTRQLADEGDASKQYLLALRLIVSAFAGYRNGMDASDPLREAYAWLQKSAKGGNADALYVGGQMRRLGIGTRADADKGRAVIAYAAAAGQPDAQEFLGVEYLNLYFQTRAEEYARTSAANFKAAAEQGRPLGELMYGRFLTEGLGLPQDTTRGVDWLIKAYRHGQMDALIYLQDAAAAGSATARTALAELQPEVSEPSP